MISPSNRPRLSAARVVVAEPFAESGLAVLRERGIEIISCVGKPESLAAALAEADGLIVRSETRVDRELLRHGPNLAVVARAGVGVDAIDVAAATDAGIVVLNTPGANTLAATEQTFALMLALVRHVPAASAALRAGIWDRKALIGTELAQPGSKPTTPASRSRRRGPTRSASNSCRSTTSCGVPTS